MQLLRLGALGGIPKLGRTCDKSDTIVGSTCEGEIGTGIREEETGRLEGCGEWKGKAEGGLRKALRLVSG